MTQGLERRIDSIRLENLLSFKHAELELRNLNVIIGPNGSGKSNLLTALEILRGTRGDFQRTVHSSGAIELRWKGSAETDDVTIGIAAVYGGIGRLSYELTFTPTLGSSTAKPWATTRVAMTSPS